MHSVPPLANTGRRRGHPTAFTLVELLVVIGIIALLMSILLPTLGRVREQANAIKCASNLRQIGTAVTLYAANWDGRIAPHKNRARWQSVANPLDQIDPNDTDAYWGVFYAIYGNCPKEVFNCPTANRASPGDAGDGSWDVGAIYTTYGINAYGVPADSGFSDAERVKLFGAADQATLFYRTTINGSAKWVGQRLTRIRHSTQTVFAQDSYEQAIDGNGDTFVLFTQWANPDRSADYLRHNKMSNVLFVDMHVSQLSRQEQSEERVYTGRW